MSVKGTTRQRRERLSRRAGKIRSEARGRLGQVIQCLMEAEQIEALKKIARAKGLSVSALTRMWLIERLDQEGWR